MTPHRRLLFYSFLVLFALAGAALLFTAQGYRYSLKKGAVELTGEIVINSSPRGAHVLLNGSAPLPLAERLMGKTTVATPARIGGLLSGDYRVSLQKDGYYPWTASVTLLPGKAAVFSDVELLPRRSFRSIPVAGEVTGTVFSGQKAVSATRDSRLILIDWRTGESRELSRLNEHIDSIAISKTGKRLSILGATHIWVAPFGVSVTQKAVARSGIKKIVWSKNDTLFALSPKGIFNYRSEKNRFELLIPGSFIDLSADGLLAALDAKRVLHVFASQRNGSDAKKVAAVQTVGTRIVSHERATIAVSDTRKNALELVSETRPIGVTRRLSQAHSLFWLDDSTCIAWDDFEVARWILGESQSSRTLMTRQSEPIAGVLAAQQSPAVFVLSQRGALWAQDMQSHDPRNLYSVPFAEQSAIQQLVLRGKELVGTAQGAAGTAIISLQIAE